MSKQEPAIILSYGRIRKRKLYTRIICATLLIVFAISMFSFRRSIASIFNSWRIERDIVACEDWVVAPSFPVFYASPSHSISSNASYLPLRHGKALTYSPDSWRRVSAQFQNDWARDPDEDFPVPSVILMHKFDSVLDSHESRIIHVGVLWQVDTRLTLQWEILVKREDPTNRLVLVARGTTSIYFGDVDPTSILLFGGSQISGISPSFQFGYQTNTFAGTIVVKIVQDDFFEDFIGKSETAKFYWKDGPEIR